MLAPLPVAAAVAVLAVCKQGRATPCLLALTPSRSGREALVPLLIRLVATDRTAWLWAPLPLVAVVAVRVTLALVEVRRVVLVALVAAVVNRAQAVLVLLVKATTAVLVLLAGLIMLAAVVVKVP